MLKRKPGSAIDRLPQLEAKAGHVKQALHDKVLEHKEYGEDVPEIRNWTWKGEPG
jgi:xylulose-5-phosphate/fructose-6-phosphate phosphoketolase